MIEIRQANKSDLRNVIEFYKIASGNPNNKARWHYGLYPTDEDLLNDIKNNELYLLLNDNQIVTAATIRFIEDPQYQTINWKRHNPAVLHILATHPSKWHQGYAKKLLIYLIDVAKKNHKDSIHLDIVKDNDIARKLYESVGFVACQDKELYYPDTGVILSTLLELAI